MPQLLKDLDGENLCVSLLLDPRYKSTEYLQLQPTGTSLPDESNLKSTITAFKETLQTSPEQIHEIERNTTMQSQSAQWFAVRKYRITASLFGEVLQRRKETPPDNLVLKILQHRQFSSPAVEWGRQKEPQACQEYVAFTQKNEYSELLLPVDSSFARNIRTLGQVLMA